MLRVDIEGFRTVGSGYTDSKTTAQDTSTDTGTTRTWRDRDEKALVIQYGRSRKPRKRARKGGGRVVGIQDMKVTRRESSLKVDTDVLAKVIAPAERFVATVVGARMRFVIRMDASNVPLEVLAPYETLPASRDLAHIRTLPALPKAIRQRSPPPPRSSPRRPRRTTRSRTHRRKSIGSRTGSRLSLFHNALRRKGGRCEARATVHRMLHFRRLHRDIRDLPAPALLDEMRDRHGEGYGTVLALTPRTSEGGGRTVVTILVEGVRSAKRGGEGRLRRMLLLELAHLGHDSQREGCAAFGLSFPSAGVTFDRDTAVARNRAVACIGIVGIPSACVGREGGFLARRAKVPGGRAGRLVHVVVVVLGRRIVRAENVVVRGRGVEVRAEPRAARSGRDGWRGGERVAVDLSLWWSGWSGSNGRRARARWPQAGESGDTKIAGLESGRTGVLDVLGGYPASETPRSKRRLLRTSRGWRSLCQRET